MPKKQKPISAKDALRGIVEAQSEQASELEQEIVLGDHEPAFSEYEPTDDYVLVGREFISIGPNIDYGGLSGAVGSKEYEVYLKDRIKAIINQIENMFKEKAISLSREKYHAHLAVACKDKSNSSKVNKANLWRTKVESSYLGPHPSVSTWSQLKFSQETQGEVFFYRRIKDA